MNESTPESRTRVSPIRITRLVSVYLLILLWVAAIAVRLVYLQVIQVDKYRLAALEQQSGFLELTSRRGDIVDRNLEELAISIRADSLFAIPSKVEDPLRTAQTLSPLLQVQTDDIYRKLLSKRHFVYLGRKLAPEQVNAVNQLKLPGLGFQKESKRVYPGRDLACHLLGFVGLDNEGLNGLEFLYDELLKGNRAKVYLRVNAKREGFERLSDTRLPDGHTLVLNLNRSIQFTTQQILREAVEQWEALNGSAVVMDPESGEVLALASYPVFDPNNYNEADEETRRNRAILEIYEPGSTFKIITLAAVLNEGLAHPEEPIDCRVGTLRLAGKVYREAKRSYGTLTFNEVLAKSSNVGTIKFGLRLGDEGLYRYITRFGFGRKTSVELPGEQSGILRPPSAWSRISIGAMSIGQEIGVTPMQMVTALSAIANGGHLVQPHLVRQILTSQGDVHYRSAPKRIRILSAETAARMKAGLALVVEGGTGRQARLNGYTSAGKTGTAQKFLPETGQYSHSKFVASYVGFAPLKQPRLAAIVVINEPRKQYYGGLVAAPAFARIMERALIQLGVPQDAPEPLKDPLQQQPVGRPRLDVASAEAPVWAEEAILPADLEEAVLSLIQPDAPEGPRPSRVEVSTGWFELPDFTGWNLRDVAREGARLGLRMKISGTGSAVGQRPPAGTRVLRESVCEVFFSTDGRKADGLIRTNLQGAGKGAKEGKPAGRQS